MLTQSNNLNSIDLDKYYKEFKSKNEKKQGYLLLYFNIFLF